MRDETHFFHPIHFEPKVAVIKANKTADGYGPALAKAFDALPDEQKPSFLFASKDIDPLRKAFGAGHAATSTLLTVGTIVSVFAVGSMEGSVLAQSVAAVIGFVSGTTAADTRSASGQKNVGCRMMDSEYAMWRMAQVEKGGNSPIKALGAGLFNGFKHNALSMTCRVVAMVIGAFGSGIVKGASILSRGLFGSSEISKITKATQNGCKKFEAAFKAIPGKSYNLVMGRDLPEVATQLCLIRLEAQSRARLRAQNKEEAALRAG